ncbi:hypothetical protein AALP_AA6G358100 [Arabis alpina]|uniref:Peptidase A1 domain-containing protein n=1 Tax=Arabis alpina TaxID=50452 RepID=A0A087GTV5_ARAAL|nr:hypothetical protein AALP_AA6G358100 [Arabis alpina]
MSLVLTLVYIFLCNSLSLSSSYSLHFPLRRTPTTNSSFFQSSLLSSPSPISFRSNFKYSVALIISLPIGTPSQPQELVLDTGSQLSWIQCNTKNKKPTTTSFDPSSSSSFSNLLCSHPLCKPRIPDFTLPTSCDTNKLCHYSYFYADGTFTEGKLVKEKFTFSNNQITPPLILGCATESSDNKGILGIKIGQKRLNISSSVFRPDAGGSGQTMIDSGSEFTYLVDVAYDKVKEEIVKLVGHRLKKGYMYGATADMCFDGNNPMEIGRLIGDLVFEFGSGVEIVVVKERVLVNVGGGIHCVGIGRSSMLGAASNIIGNVHQQNLWVEFDLTNRRVGFSKTECSGLKP